MSGSSPSQPGENKLWHVKQCPLFDAMEGEDLRALTDLANVVSYGPMEIIPSDTFSEQSVWVVKRGHIKLNYSDVNGRQAAVLLLSPGDFFGSLNPPPASARAKPLAEAFGEHCETLTAACLCRFPRNRFDTFLKRHPDLALRLAHATFDRIARLQIRLADLMTRSAESRLALVLLELALLAGHQTPRGLVIDVPVTHADLAQLIGTSREMVSYVMRRFRDEGYLESGRKEILLLDPRSLEEVRDQ